MSRVKYLPMQVRDLDNISINEPKRPDASANQIGCCRTSQTSDTNNKDGSIS